jgi:hypothetical protein
MQDSHPTRNRAPNSVKKPTTSWCNEDDALLFSLAGPGFDGNWVRITPHFPAKTAQQIADRWNKVLNPDLVKGSWTIEEDDAIMRWVATHGPKSWTSLAQTLQGRLGKQCRERWVNSLDPDLVRKPWTAAEDEILIDHQKKWGNKWAQIANLLPGRTDNSVKNRWNSSLKRRLERIARGQNPVLKRGRKPKRPSAPPDLGEMPKPDFSQLPAANPTPIQFSPISSAESPFGLISPQLLHLRSPFTPFSLGTPLAFKSPAFAFETSPVPFRFESDPPDRI